MDKILFDKQRIIYIDATPDENYVLRILRAYRQDCNIHSSIGINDEQDSFTKMLNEMQDKRKIILDKAIEIFENENKNIFECWKDNEKFKDRINYPK